MLTLLGILFALGGHPFIGAVLVILAVENSLLDTIRSQDKRITSLEHKLRSLNRTTDQGNTTEQSTTETTGEQ